MLRANHRKLCCWRDVLRPCPHPAGAGGRGVAGGAPSRCRAGGTGRRPALAAAGKSALLERHSPGCRLAPNLVRPLWLKNCDLGSWKLHCKSRRGRGITAISHIPFWPLHSRCGRWCCPRAKPLAPARRAPWRSSCGRERSFTCRQGWAAGCGACTGGGAGALRAHAWPCSPAWWLPRAVSVPCPDLLCSALPGALGVCR